MSSRASKVKRLRRLRVKLRRLQRLVNNLGRKLAGYAPLDAKPAWRGR